MSLTFQEALVQVLTADAGVSAITTAIHPQEAYADESPPYALFVASGDTQTLGVTGYVNQFTATIRFDCYGAPPAYSSAHALASAIDAALKAFLRGTVTRPSDGAAVLIQGVFDSGGEDDLDPPLDGQEKGYDYVARSYEVVYALLN